MKQILYSVHFYCVILSLYIFNSYINIKINYWCDKILYQWSWIEISNLDSLQISIKQREFLSFYIFILTKLQFHWTIKTKWRKYVNENRFWIWKHYVMDNVSCILLLSNVLTIRKFIVFDKNLILCSHIITHNRKINFNILIHLKSQLQ